jgi:hypothetical protein
MTATTSSWFAESVLLPRACTGKESVIVTKDMRFLNLTLGMNAQRKD